MNAIAFSFYAASFFGVLHQLWTLVVLGKVKVIENIDRW
jgi:hypothetical protein